MYLIHMKLMTKTHSDPRNGCTAATGESLPVPRCTKLTNSSLFHLSPISDDQLPDAWTRASPTPDREHNTPHLPLTPPLLPIFQLCSVRVPSLGRWVLHRVQTMYDINPYVHTSIHPYIHTSIHPYIHTSILCTYTHLLRTSTATCARPNALTRYSFL